MDSLTFSVRTARDPVAAMADIHQVLRAVDSAVPIRQSETADELIERQLQRERMMASLGTAFGGLALAIAAIGLYALLAHSVVTRTREIGVRLAVGACRRDVVSLVIQQAAALLAVGAAIGVPLAAAGSWMVRNQLFGVRPAEPLVLGSAAVLMAAVAAMAAIVPAWRAARVDPVQALRHE
jgi:ABC-type antimicrobial peptide transport system permease subunit